eukprot:4437897-Karenia_brevis.AAC.1
MEVSGELQFMVVVKAGILQGCPLSGTLFAIAADPFFVMFKQRIVHPQKGLVLGCADDVGCVLGSFLGFWDHGQNF